MVYVVLRSGKVLQYNTACAICVEDHMVTLRTDEVAKGGFLVARIPLDVIERTEFSRPCAIYRTRPLKNRRLY